MLATRECTISEVSAQMIGYLEQTGRLPKLPPQCEVNRSVFGFRHPNYHDGARLRWLLAWPNPTLSSQATGVLGYRDEYDFHTASDVRVVTYLAGRRRAVIDLLRKVARESRAEGRRLIGAVDCHNQSLARHIARDLGAIATRTVFEVM
jgi:hypothetical protein